MTNHEKFAEITGVDNPVEIEAVKMLLATIEEDVERDSFAEDTDAYLSLYKAQVEWLNSECDAGKEAGG